MINMVLDTSKHDQTNPSVIVRVGDGGVDTIHAVVMDNGAPFNLAGYTAEFRGVTPAGTLVADSSVQIDGQNEVTYTMPAKVASVSGKFERAYFVFTNGAASTSTANIRLEVLADADMTADEAGTYVSEYDKLREQLQADYDAQIKKFQVGFDELDAKAKEISDAYDKGDFYNKAEVDDKVNGFATTLQVDNKLANYYTKSEINTKFASYYTQTQIDSKLGSYYTQAQVNAKLGDYYPKTTSDSRFVKAGDMRVPSSKVVGTDETLIIHNNYVDANVMTNTGVYTVAAGTIYNLPVYFKSGTLYVSSQNGLITQLTVDQDGRTDSRSRSTAGVWSAWGDTGWVKATTNANVVSGSIFTRVKNEAAFCRMSQTKFKGGLTGSVTVGQTNNTALSEFFDKVVFLPSFQRGNDLIFDADASGIRIVFKDAWNANNLPFVGDYLIGFAGKN